MRILDQYTRQKAWFDDHRDLLLVIAISLGLKVALASIGRVINPDGVLYIASAQQYAIGNFSEGLRLWPMPAYPFLIALVHFVIPDWIAAVRIISIGCLVLASIPLYGIASILFNRQAAFWTALCLAITPEASENALRSIRDPAYLLLTFTAIFFILKGISHKQLRWIAGGLFLAGCSLLFRVEGVVILSAPVFFFVILSLVNKDMEMKCFARKSLTFWIGLPLAVGVVLAAFFGSYLLTINRTHELVNELKYLVNLSAFEKYNQIYFFFKTIQDQPPFSGFSHSLPATVRHWMPLIYLIGLLESLVKQIFPIFLLPIIFTKKLNDWKVSNLSYQKQFVLLVFLAYMLFLFYFLITRDRMVGRLLFTPAVLLYPWVGNGFYLMIEAIQKQKIARALQIIALIVFITVPCMESARAVLKSDLTAHEVGNYIIHNIELNNAKILFSETRHWLYSNSKENFNEILIFSYQANEHIKKNRIMEIERIAQKMGADAIVLAFNSKGKTMIPNLMHYAIDKRFPERKGITVIYKRRE